MWEGDEMVYVTADPKIIGLVIGLVVGLFVGYGACYVVVDVPSLNRRMYDLQWRTGRFEMVVDPYWLRHGPPITPYMALSIVCERFGWNTEALQGMEYGVSLYNVSFEAGGGDGV